MSQSEQSGNTSTGKVEDWKLALIAKRAVKLRFRGADLDDAIQHAVLSLRDFKYDPHNSRRASEPTALSGWIDYVLLPYRRAQKRAKDRCERYAALQTTLVEGKNVELCDDVQNAIKTLPEFGRKVCELICAGLEVRDLPTALNRPMSEVFSAILSVRRHFIELGLNEWLYEK